MSEEQKAAAAERLAKAREVRLKKNPPKLKHVHPDVLALPEDDHLSYVKVKGWIKANKEKLPELNRQARQNVKGALAQYESVRTYITSMENYLKSSTWTSMFAGEDQQTKVVFRCTTLAYDKDGNVKRSRGVYYDDLGFVWGSEPDDNS
tara:strand:- start:52 stop:498 length:447 start_codon:yes stop_codon:yes gene_type:complete